MNTKYLLAYQDDHGRAVSWRINDQDQLEREMDKLVRRGVEFNVYVPGVEGIAGHTFRTDEGVLTYAVDYGEVEDAS